MGVQIIFADLYAGKIVAALDRQHPRLAYDAGLVRDVLQIFVCAVFASIRRRAGIPASDRQASCGAVTFVQRFGDALNLNVHFHTLALDGNLCRYAGRPPLATGRLSALPDGRLLYRLKRRWRDGTTHMIFEPLDLVA